MSTARTNGLRVIGRCNLTILSEPGCESLADFLAANEVEVTTSLPCYLEENVDHQCGDGVFRRSLGGLRSLNAPGCGRPIRVDEHCYGCTAGQGSSCRGAVIASAAAAPACANSTTCPLSTSQTVRKKRLTRFTVCGRRKSGAQQCLGAAHELVRMAHRREAMARIVGS